jgi:hypothetical protein
MADIDLAATGKDAQIVFTVNGNPVRVQDAVVKSSAEAVLTTIEQKHLGTSDVDIDIDSEGWRGTLEISARNATVDEFLDVVDAAIRTRTAIVINVVETTKYRDGTSKTYTYPDCKFTAAAKNNSRGEVTTHTISWRTGKARLAT